MKKFLYAAIAATLTLTSCQRQLSDVERECLDIYHKQVFQEAQYQMVSQELLHPIVTYLGETYLEKAADAYAKPILEDEWARFGADLGGLLNMFDGNYSSKSLEEIVYDDVAAWGNWCTEMITRYDEKAREAVENLDEIINAASDDDGGLDVDREYMQSSNALESWCRTLFSTPGHYKSENVDTLLKTYEDLVVTWLCKYEPTVPKLLEAEYYGDSLWRLVYDDGSVKCAEFIVEENGDTWVRVDDIDPRFF